MSAAGLPAKLGAGGRAGGFTPRPVQAAAWRSHLSVHLSVRQPTDSPQGLEPPFLGFHWAGHNAKPFMPINWFNSYTRPTY